ncbi:MAG: alpha/beta hydrolase [Lachnospiraceae bacterium]|nr:alpha/beta hydrolase [Lachnospiraceae bacterium]
MTVFLIIIGILAVFILIVLFYYNKAFPEAQEIADKMDMIDRDYWFHGDKKIGFLIFTGAQTDEPAYAYIAYLLHRGSYPVVIPKQPFQMSAFGVKHGMEIMESHPEIEKWILIGHSLGGVPVSRIAAARPDQVIGAAFLATYASADLSGLDISAIRIVAENDGIMDNDRMPNFNHNLPEDSATVIIKGANHQGFAAYDSLSNRDGKATISWQEQNELSVRYILEFFEEQISEVVSD